MLPLSRLRCWLGSDLSEVAGLSWPITLTGSGSGNYQGVIDKAAVLQRRRVYVLRVTAAEGTIDAQWDLELVSDYRK